MNTITGSSQPFEIREKRFYIPDYIISSSCPKCGEIKNRDLSDEYLTYPKANIPIKIGMYCEHYSEERGNYGCGNEWEVTIKILVTVEVVNN